MFNNLIIRTAQLSDAAALTELFNSDTNVFGEDGTGYGINDVSEYLEDQRKKMFVCEHEGIVIGALLAEYHRTYVYLDTMIIAKDFQHKGIGAGLFKYFEADLHDMGIPLIEVLTEVNNTVMQKFLANRGFRKGNTFIFYSKGE